MIKCRKCFVEQPKENFYKATKQDYLDKICKSCKSEASRLIKNKNKFWAVEYKGGKCQKCGYNKCIGALEFHHIIRKVDDIGIEFANIRGLSEEKRKAELEKCILVCANCHREIHYEDGTVGKW